jgi:hypothetical protein
LFNLIVLNKTKSQGILLVTLQTNKRINNMDLSETKTLKDFQEAFLEIKDACEKEIGSTIKHVEIFYDNDIRITFSNK